MISDIWISWTAVICIPIPRVIEVSLSWVLFIWRKVAYHHTTCAAPCNCIGSADGSEPLINKLVAATSFNLSPESFI